MIEVFTHAVDVITFSHFLPLKSAQNVNQIFVLSVLVKNVLKSSGLSHFIEYSSTTCLSLKYYVNVVVLRFINIETMNNISSRLWRRMRGLSRDSVSCVGNMISKVISANMSCSNAILSTYALMIVQKNLKIPKFLIINMANAVCVANQYHSKQKIV